MKANKLPNEIKMWKKFLEKIYDILFKKIENSITKGL